MLVLPKLTVMEHKYRRNIICVIAFDKYELVHVSYNSLYMVNVQWIWYGCISNYCGIPTPTRLCIRKELYNKNEVIIQANP